MKTLALASILVLCLPLTAGSAITNQFGPYYGKVIDTETKEPLEGAAVLVVFYTNDYGPAGAIIRYADAVETVTDKNGEFKIDAKRIFLFRPLQGWDPNGYFTVFKPGYGCYPTHKAVKPMRVPNGTLPEDHSLLIELPRLKTREEKIDTPDINFDIPYEKQKYLIELINHQMEQLGATGKYTKESFVK